MQYVLIDKISHVGLHNGMMRVDCVSVGPNGHENPSGVLLIPPNIAGQFVRALASAMGELEKNIRKQHESQATNSPQSPN
jgi:hypothetical protein